ncbi:isocitrate/isopropylmalate dehydrogenase family protein [Candidatus Bathyarchaeota archaeon]|nr:isocitrate/isopropylmalate dehydrogenase family protein [Candidatus Bathyarchaeota archaeon]
MVSYTVPVLAGDGIGPEVMAEGVKVLDAASEVHSFEIEWVRYPYGAEHYLETGEILPDSALKEMGKNKAIYFAAVGDPRCPPGLLERGIILKLRFQLDQYVNLRPVCLIEGVPTPLKGKTPKDINFSVVRENTEDMYVGLGGRAKRGRSRHDLELVRSLYTAKFGLDIETDHDEIAYQLMVISKLGAERVIRYTFEHAVKTGKKRVTSVDKANVLPEAYGFWREVFNGVKKEYPKIETEFSYVDAITMWFVKNPEWFQVVVAPNMFGDIITDLGAMIQGGLGVAAGGNINPEGTSMFEPIHGSAPKYRGKNVVNPVATVLAGAMLLDSLGELEASNAVEQAVNKVLGRGRVRTRDLGGSSTTSEVGDAIAREILKRE